MRADDLVLADIHVLDLSQDVAGLFCAKLLAGLTSIIGYDDSEPLMTNATYPDPVVGILALGALMTALRRRRQTGQGTCVDLSRREITVNLLGRCVLDYALTERVAGPMGNRHAVNVPQGVYPCQGNDRWLAISVGSEAHDPRGPTRAVFSSVYGRFAPARALHVYICPSPRPLPGGKGE
jgi:crotonobetainyl-CoA:carnitine CoA-transferase CaiB-like acyl-CoA transferase